MTAPNPHLALVLSGGGAQAAYQVGVLQAIAERTPGLPVPIITGVSAGAINAAYLAAHTGSLSKAIDDLRGQWQRLTSGMIYGVRSFALMRSAARWIEGMAMGRGPDLKFLRGLLDNRPLREFLEAGIDFAGIDANIASQRLRAVAITATSYGTGNTVTFVQGGADLPMWKRVQRVAVHAKLTLDHVMASAAIPIVFPAVRIEGGFYADGSVQQSSPLAPAIHLGAGRVLAIGTRPLATPVIGSRANAGHPSPVEALTLLLDSIFLDALDVDAERLQRLNQLLTLLPPDVPTPGGLKPVDLMVVRPSRDLGLIAAECARSFGQLPRTIRILTRGMGVRPEAGAGFLSYLLFEPAYTGKLVELGYKDATAQAESIRKFVEGR